MSLSMGVPNPTALLSDNMTVEPWVRQLFYQKIGDSASSVLEALGLLVRFAKTDRKLSREEVIAVLSQPDFEPWKKIREWAEPVSQSFWDSMVKSAIADRDTIVTLISDFEHYVEHGAEDHARVLIPMIVFRRDDLESLAAVLRVLDKDEGLEEELDSLDALGRRILPIIERIGRLPDDERLWQASCVNPLAWWPYAAEIEHLDREGYKILLQEMGL